MAALLRCIQTRINHLKTCKKAGMCGDSYLKLIDETRTFILTAITDYPQTIPVETARLLISSVVEDAELFGFQDRCAIVENVNSKTCHNIKTCHSMTRSTTVSVCVCACARACWRTWAWSSSTSVVTILTPLAERFSRTLSLVLHSVVFKTIRICMRVCVAIILGGLNIIRRPSKPTKMSDSAHGGPTGRGVVRKPHCSTEAALVVEIFVVLI